MNIKITNLIEIPFHSEKISQEIKKALTIENPEWVKRQRQGLSCYNISHFFAYYNTLGDKIFAPRGFLPELIHILSKNNIDFQIDRKHILLPEVNFEFIKELRNYQQSAANILLKRNEGVLTAGTGAGKTVIALYLTSKRKQPAIILVHTKELLEQWIERIKFFLDTKKVGVIGDGIFDPEPITVSIVNSLVKRKEVLSNFGYLIADECHKLPTNTWTDIISEYQGPYISGFSATPYRNDGLDKVIEWNAGPILHTITPQELIAEGYLVSIEPIIRKTLFNYPDAAANYSKMLSAMSINEERNSMIIADVIQEIRSKGICLVLSDRKSHLERMMKMMPSKYKMELLTGSINASERKRIVEGINSGELNGIFATAKLIGEGFDCPNLTSLFLTMPIRYSGNIIQYIGRILRPKEGKGKAPVYDYRDVSIGCLYAGFKEKDKIFVKLM